MNIDVPFWRVTRTDRARAVYDWLAERGVKAARMALYVGGTVDAPGRDPPAGVSIAVEPPAVAADASLRDADALDPSDRVVVARRGGELVGYCYLSHGREVYVDAVEESWTFDGTYLWRLHVLPAHRERGVGSAVVAHARMAARDAFGADAVYALVAADNRPSQWTFEAAGFAVRESVTFVRVGGFRWRRRTGRDAAA